MITVSRSTQFAATHAYLPEPSRRCKTRIEIERIDSAAVRPQQRRAMALSRVVPARNVMAVVSESSDTLDAVVPVLFTIATIALSFVTLGVIYLNVSSWLESRSEPKKKQLEKKEYDDSMKEFMTSARGAQSKDKKPIKKATDKGFGPS